jgi:hypothetical protein
MVSILQIIEWRRFLKRLKNMNTTENLEKAAELLKESISFSDTGDNVMVSMVGSECDECGWYYPVKMNDGTTWTDENTWCVRVARFLVSIGEMREP